MLIRAQAVALSREGLSQRAIAVRLGISKRYCAQNLTYSHEELQKSLFDEGDD